MIADANHISNLVNDGYIEINSDNETEFEEYLLNFIENPLVWKETNSRQIEQLPINEFLKQSIIYFHRNNKSILSWEKYQIKSGFSEIEMETIKLFIVLEKSKNLKAKIYNYNSMQREKQTSITKNLTRLNLNSATGWYFSGISERDNEEVHIFDHLNFSIKSPNYFNRIELMFGSFRFRWGTGLFFNTNPMNLMSNSGSANLYRSDAKFRNYSGSDENNYLFGSSVFIRMKYFSIYSFYSQNNLDCRFENEIVTSIDNSGIHVSDIQIENANTLNNKSYGIGITSKLNYLKTGLLYYHSKFNYRLEDFGNQKQLSGLSFFHNYQKNNLSINGELAISSNQKFALTQSVQYRLDKTNIGVCFRYFEPDFNSFSGSILRHYGGNLNNEKGFYYYFGTKITETIKMSLFTDYFTRFIPQNEGGIISKGNQSGIYLQKRLKTKSYIEMKLSRKNDSDFPKNTYNIKVTNEITKNYFLTTRYIYINITDFNNQFFSQGFSSYITIKNIETSITIGLTHYFSNNSDCRLYLYEPGIPMRFNMVSLSGTGRNYFISYNYQINENTNLFLAAKQRSKNSNDKYYLQIQLLVAL